MPLGLFPLLAPPELADIFTRLVRALASHDYAATGAIPSPGRPWNVLREPENLRNFLSGGNNAFEASAWASIYRRACAVQHPAAVVLHATFHLGAAVARDELARLLGDELTRDLERCGALVTRGSDLVPRIRATSFPPIIVISDTSSVHEEEKGSFVFCGRCSSRLVDAARAALVGRRRGGRSLDLCTGSGVQALNVAASFDEVWGGDLNPRAVAFARANAAANGIDHARFVESNLFANFEGTFDLVTANTPFLLLDEGSRALDGYGGKYGMEVEMRLFADLDKHLRSGATSLVVASSAFVDGRNLLIEQLSEVFANQPYAIDLFPVSQYYSTSHYRAYEAVNVRKCVLYVVRLQKDAASRLELRDHPFGALKAAVLEAKVRIEREIARRRYLKVQQRQARV